MGQFIKFIPKVAEVRGTMSAGGMSGGIAKGAEKIYKATAGKAIKKTGGLVQRSVGIISDKKFKELSAKSTKARQVGRQAISEGNKAVALLNFQEPNASKARKKQVRKDAENAHLKKNRLKRKDVVLASIVPLKDNVVSSAFSGIKNIGNIAGRASIGQRKNVSGKGVKTLIEKAKTVGELDKLQDSVDRTKNYGWRGHRFFRKRRDSDLTERIQKRREELVKSEEKQ